jgi:hypothetical protein
MPLADPSVLVAREPGIPLPGRPAFELDSRGARKLAGFLIANRHQEPIALAAMESFLVAPLIIEYDLPAVALGGFSGSDRAVGVGRFAQMVRQGQLRFVLVAMGQGPANAELLEWIARNGRPVAPELWRIDEPNLAVPNAKSHDDPREMFATIRRETRLFDLRPNLGIVTQAGRAEPERRPDPLAAIRDSWLEARGLTHAAFAGDPGVQRGGGAPEPARDVAPGP